MNRTLFAALACAALLAAATRPHYGGTLRIELRDAIWTADPPQLGAGIPDLFASFTVTRWEAGHRAIFAATETAPGGRPFLDGIEIEMGRGEREQLADLNLGRADIVELGPGEVPRLQGGRRVWTSSPVRIVALVFAPKVDDARVREALACSVDREAIHRVLLQNQGEISGALLPQWLSGDAFLFPGVTDPKRARQLMEGVAARSLTLAAPAPELRAIADRIVLNARDAGLALAIVPSGGAPDVRLVEARIASLDGARSLATVAAALSLPDPQLHGESPEALYTAERALLDGLHAVPLFHLPDMYLVTRRVKGGPGISPRGEWRFEDVWLEGGRQ